MTAIRSSATAFFGPTLGRVDLQTAVGCTKNQRFLEKSLVCCPRFAINPGISILSSEKKYKKYDNSLTNEAHHGDNSHLITIIRIQIHGRFRCHPAYPAVYSRWSTESSHPRLQRGSCEGRRYAKHGT